MNLACKSKNLRCHRQGEWRHGDSALGFPWEHEKSVIPVSHKKMRHLQLRTSNLWQQAGATGMELLQHLRDNKDPLWTETPHNKPSWELARWDEENTTSQSHSPRGCLPDACQRQASSDGQQPENSILARKPSSQDKNKRKGKHIWLVGLVLTMNNTKDKGKNKDQLWEEEGSIED